MKCIVLYGPPAVGKLAVADELTKSLRAKIVDNAKIIDFVQPLISRDNPEFVGLVYSLQLQILNAAMRLGTEDIIFTLPFSASAHADVAFIQTILEIGARHDVTVVLVHLTAKKRVLLERVTHESRKTTGKLTDPDILKAMLDQYDMENPYPSAPSVNINTTHLTVQEAAQQILRNLPAAPTL